MASKVKTLQSAGGSGELDGKEHPERDEGKGQGKGGSGAEKESAEQEPTSVFPRPQVGLALAAVLVVLAATLSAAITRHAAHAHIQQALIRHAAASVPGAGRVCTRASPNVASFLQPWKVANVGENVVNLRAEPRTDADKVASSSRFFCRALSLLVVCASRECDSIMPCFTSILT